MEQEAEDLKARTGKKEFTDEFMNYLESEIQKAIASYFEKNWENVSMDIKDKLPENFRNQK